MLRSLLTLGATLTAALLLAGLGGCQRAPRAGAKLAAQPGQHKTDGSTLAQPGIAAAPQRDTRPSSVTLPPDWPLPELTAPPGTKAAPMPCAAPRGYGDEHMIRCLPFNMGTKQEGQLWRVGFSYDRGPDIAMQHLEDCLRPLGFYLYWSEQGHGREFISPDGRYIAQMYYWPDEQVYHLQVSVYREPWLREQPAPRSS